MTRPRIFIDGHAGTTGLRIRELLSSRTDIEIAEIDPARRKDPEARGALLNSASVSILCLPDDAAREAARLTVNPDARLIDASTAHRVAEGWVYGLPELAPGQRERIAGARRVANPGCYPTGFLLSVRPLVDAGILGRDAPVTVHALSGYSGGGNALITKWEASDDDLRTLPYEAPYALDRRHKHVPEMVAYSGLSHDPQFVPAVGPFLTGMRLEVPLHASVLRAGTDARQIFRVLEARYADELLVDVRLSGPDAIHERSFDPRACNGTSRVSIHVVGNPSGHVLLVTLLDNLGKGAAGAAVQSLNLMLGVPELTGLSS